MSVLVNADACIGCGACAAVCPGNLLAVKDGTAYSRSPKDCWGCTACLKECPSGAVEYFLGADVGGRGARLSVCARGSLKIWTFRRPDGCDSRIVVDSAQANRY